MRHLLFSAAAFAVLATAASAQAPSSAAPRPFTARDLVMLDRVGDPHISPDGKLVAYDVRSTDWEKNKGVHSVWIATLDGSAPPRRLAASDGGATSPRWSADGRRLYFLSGRSGSDQLWMTDAAGAGATQATKLPLDVGSYRVSPDGRRLVVSMAVFPDCPTVACTVQRQAEKKAAKTTGQVYDKLFVRHWDEWADGTKNALFAVALGPDGAAAGEPTGLMRGFDGDAPSKPFGDDQDYSLSPDGATVYFSARLAGRTEPWSTNFDIWRVPVDGSRPPEDLTPDNKAWDAEPRVSPDGTQLAWRAMKRPGFESDRFGVWVMDLKTGAKREIDPQWDRSAETLRWSADGMGLYVATGDVGQHGLFWLPLLDQADAKALQASKVGFPTASQTGAGHAGDFDVSDRSIVYAQDALDRPADLFSSKFPAAADVGKGLTLYSPVRPIQLTHQNADKLAGVGMASFEQFSFPGWNGETVHGYLVKPAGFQPGRKYPVAFLIHGGPQGSFGNSFGYRWNPQTYAGRGYAVVMVDFHGSTGYGQAFTDAISQHWGDRPLEDLQKGWAYALAKYPFLDADHACALGASYGGYMVNWIAGNWSAPWKCLVVHDGVFDNRMMGYATEELWFSEWENGGTPWANPAGYERFNPVDHVAAWTKPQLVIHGGKDYRIPLEQGLGAFTALQRKGVESRFLTFPDENHWVLKPQNSVQWHDTVEAWLKRWTSS